MRPPCDPAQDGLPVLQKVHQLLAENESLKHEYRLLWKNTLPFRLEKIIEEQKIINGTTVISAILDTTDKADLREAGDFVKAKIASGIIILASGTKEDKISLIIMLTDDLINKGYDAGKLILPIAEAINGQGGGKRHFAQAGGTDLAKLKNIFQNIGQYIHI